jgi:alkylation response protein AidB-like acyl-CoA dehydrogenase
MDFEIPEEIRRKLDELDAFIEREIAPLERENIQYFDHRREHARTDWENGGRPRREWEELCARCAARRRGGSPALRAAQGAGRAGGSNLAMAIIREHLAAKGLACTTISRTNRRSSATSRA